MKMYATQSSQVRYIIRRITSWVGSEISNAIIEEQRSIPVCLLIVFLNYLKLITFQFHRNLTLTYMTEISEYIPRNRNDFTAV